MNDGITVQQMDELLERLKSKRGEVDAQKMILSRLNKELTCLQNDAVVALKALGRESYKGPGLTVGIRERISWTLPKDDDKIAFFNYLKDKGLYDRYATVQANSFSAFCEAEYQQALDSGEMLDLPGVDDLQNRKVFEQLSVRSS